MAIELLTRAKGYFEHSKKVAFEKALAEALVLLGRSDSSYYQIARAFKLFASNETQKTVAEHMKKYLTPGEPGQIFLSNLAKDVHPNYLRKYVARFITNIIFHNNNDKVKLEDGREVPIPAALLISPTMRCNLKCVGCYAGNYTRKDDLTQEEVESFLGQARDLGVRYFIILGGEPLIWKPLFDIFDKFSDCAFQFYTSGHLLDEDKVQRLVKAGNAVPCVSLEGFEGNTNARRGNGGFARAMRAMDLLREAGALFAFSVTATHENTEEVVSDEFIDLMIEKGAKYGWYFAYCPVGREPNVEYMPTPEQRNHLRVGVNRIRATKPILVADFWNDGPLSEGCLAGGRRYLHINNKGDVEPCIFIHYATHNLRQVPLSEALASEFFSAFRQSQPYGRVLLRPCPIIDRPHMLRNAVERFGAYPTHDGAEVTINGLAEHLDDYAENLRKVYKKVWKEEMGWVKLLYKDTYNLDDNDEDIDIAGCPLCR